LNLNYLLGALMFGLGANMLVSMYAVFWPGRFRLSVVPGIAGGLSAAVLAGVFVTSREGALGLTTLALAVVFIAVLAAFFLSLNLYALWGFFRGRAAEDGTEGGGSAEGRRDAAELRRFSAASLRSSAAARRRRRPWPASRPRGSRAGYGCVAKTQEEASSRTNAGPTPSDANWPGCSTSSPASA